MKERRYRATYLNLSTKQRRMSILTVLPLNLREGFPVRIGWEAAWAVVTVWTRQRKKILPLTKIGPRSSGSFFTVQTDIEIPVSDK